MPAAMSPKERAPLSDGGLTVKSGRVFWFTGLSGVGKTTMCRLFVQRLRASGRPVVMLDGDALRAVFGAETAHAPDERLQLSLRYAALCRMIAAEGVDVAIATISLFKEVHAWNRAHIAGYHEILLTAPLSELVRRDPKQIYARAARGDLSNVVGVDVDYDLPAATHYRIDFDPLTTPEVAADRLIAELRLANE